MMHKPEHCFKKCLKEGAAYREKGAFFACIRTEPCPLKREIGTNAAFCATPLKEGAMKLGHHGLGNKMG